MAKAIQQRALKTRAKLLDAAQAVVFEQGFEALRVEEVVKRAGVAKGTFFAHFKDKDALMDQLIGTEMNRHLDQIATLEPPKDIDSLIEALLPGMQLATRERYVFDVILRHSGAAANAEIGPIASTFARNVEVLANWLARGPFRKDIDPVLMADGVGAFQIQAMALSFCAIHNGEPMESMMKRYLEAWLLPKSEG